MMGVPGARWDKATALWQVPCRAARILSLVDRIATHQPILAISFSLSHPYPDILGH